MPFAIAFFLLLLVIVIHEGGHFLAARAVGIPIRSFSIGFGPELFGKQIGGTYYRIGAIPLGGYVMPVNEDKLYEQPRWKRLALYAGGPLTNMYLPTAIFALVALANGNPEFAAKLMSVPWMVLTDIASWLVQPNVSEMSSIVGITAHGGGIVEKYDFVEMMLFFLLMNISIGVCNLIPLPVLDGGRIVMLAFEGIPGWRKAELPLLIASGTFMVGLSLYLIGRDISNLL